MLFAAYDVINFNKEVHKQFTFQFTFFSSHFPSYSEWFDSSGVDIMKSFITFKLKISIKYFKDQHLTAWTAKIFKIQNLNLKPCDIYT